MTKEFNLVGILNTTPDSFSDGGLYIQPGAALERAYTMFQDGASIIDVGGESTRPGAKQIEPEAEQQRIFPVLEKLIPSYTDAISVDTYHPETVRKIAAEIGPFVVNDVTGMNNPAMREAVAELGLRCVLSHLPISSGQDIQKAHRTKPVDSPQQVVDDIGERTDELIVAGVEEESIWVDPGIGFGKDPKIYNALLELPELIGQRKFNYYIGLSRKSSLKKQDFYKEDLADFAAMEEFDKKNGTDTLTTWLDWRSVEMARIALANGFTYFRVHNVAAHKAGLGA